MPECNCRGRTQRQPEGGYFERKPNTAPSRSPRARTSKEITLKKTELDSLKAPRTQKLKSYPQTQTQHPEQKTQHPLDAPYWACRACRLVKESCFATLGSQSATPSTSPRAPCAAAKRLEANTKISRPSLMHDTHGLNTEDIAPSRSHHGNYKKLLGVLNLEPQNTKTS